jgi:predicted PurR-regulated permease PerM
MALCVHKATRQWIVRDPERSDSLQVLTCPLAATAMSVLVVLNRFIWIDYLEVKMFGRHLNIDSILLFLWLAYWGWVWGVIGLILSFPMVASLKIVLEQLDTTKSWAVLMSDE